MQNVQNKGQIQNEFMRSSFLPKYQPIITEISALPSNKLNLLRVDKKTVKRERIQICLLMFYSQLHTIYQMRSGRQGFRKGSKNLV